MARRRFVPTDELVDKSSGVDLLENERLPAHEQLLAACRGVDDARLLAFLLWAVQGWTQERIGKVMGRSRARVTNMISDCRREIRANIFPGLGHGISGGLE